MEAFGEYRVGNNGSGEHWVECRGEVIAQVTMGGTGAKPWRYRPDGAVRIVSAIPTWTFDGTYPSVGHALADAARSHRSFVEPIAVKRLWRGIALWPAWGKIAAVVVGLAALAEILGYFAPHGGTQLVAWLAGWIGGPR